MRYYFFGDIHGNIYALERCLAHMEEVKADEAVCLGDLVGWLPFGDRTLERMRSLAFPTVSGNHDLLVAGLFPDHPRQLDRMQASAYNAGLLSNIGGASDYLLSLPLKVERENLFVAVHHSPFHLPAIGKAPSIECFDYLDEAALAASLPKWRDYPYRLILSGHDHVPAVYELPDSASVLPKVEDIVIHRPPKSENLILPINPHSRYWVKAGSVGGPYRDGVPVANSVLYDSAGQTLTLFRLPYPVENLRRELASHRFFGNIPTMRRYLELLAE